MHPHAQLRSTHTPVHLLNTAPDPFMFMCYFSREAARQRTPKRIPTP